MKFKNYFLGLAICISCCTSPSEKRNDKKANDSEDTNVSMISTMANTFYEHDDYSNAIKYFDKLIDRDSTNGQYYFRRGYSYARLIKKKDAIEDYKRAIKYHFKVASANYNIGLNYSYDNDSLALYFFKKCIEADSSFVDAYSAIQDCEKRIKLGETR
ncbi:MAG TPA: hypothetical protein VHE34_17285 [Puia sp.]|uniref:tetratricopeptide repeat protein n=1 Tax=Puia sp. TaxID=2045100 RepID=UPI002B947C0B|nr:hypothetical protein [Puia sp.]HVU96989.1 hypothetical protein [Puia sp.]